MKRLKSLLGFKMNIVQMHLRKTPGQIDVNPPVVHVSRPLTYLNGIRQVQQPSDRVASVLESPEECLSKPQAGIFMAVFNSLSVAF